MPSVKSNDSVTALECEGAALILCVCEKSNGRTARLQAENLAGGFGNAQDDGWVVTGVYKGKLKRDRVKLAVKESSVSIG